MPELSRQYAKLCDIEDFEDERLRSRAAELRPDLDLQWQFDRKSWEMANATLLLEDCDLLVPASEVLSVAAGKEAVLFWLARRVGRTVATDIYGRGEFASTEAPPEMLADPWSFDPHGGPPGNLEVAEMDARELRFADATFDAVICLSSIEHFGSPADIRRAAAEIGRVLRPGGVAYIATELQLAPAPGPRRALEAAVRGLSGGRVWRREVFTPETLQRDVIEPSGLRLMQPLDLGISPRSYANLAHRRWRGDLRTASGRFHPHIVLEVRGERFTSVGLPLRKPD